MAEAVGILEVFGLATAFVAADAGCKAAMRTACQYRFLSASSTAEACQMSRQR